MLTKFNLSNNFKTKEDLFFLSFFIIGLLYNIIFTFIHIDQPLVDMHTFRQTQTAVTVQSILRDGITFPYQTPIFGFPWSIPMEFPIYQYIVAAFCFLFNLPVDLAGRLVSAIFFYISLFPAYKIFQRTSLGNNSSLLFIAFLLINPLYLYWSRTFMIETITLCFSLFFLNYFILYFENNKLNHFVLCLLFGTLSSLSKITTFVPFLLAAGMYFVYLGYQNKIYQTLKNIIKYSIAALILALIPVVIGKVWVDYSDTIKEMNPLSTFITSKNLTKWNFGTIKQKLDLNTWHMILNHSFWKPYIFTISIIKFFLIGVIIGGLLLYFKNKSLAFLYFVLFFLYISAPLIFTNLHTIHNYYPSSNTIFAIAGITLFFNHFISYEQKYLKYISYCLPFVFIFYNVYIYFGHDSLYYKSTTNYENKYNSINLFSTNNTQFDDIFLIIQDDWSSEIPYELNRKSILINNRHIIRGTYSSSDLLNVIDKSEPQKTTYLLVAENMVSKEEKESIISIIKQKFEIEQTPAFQDKVNGFTIYAIKYKL